MITLRSYFIECFGSKNKVDEKLMEFGSGECYKRLTFFIESIDLYQLSQAIEMKKTKLFPNKLVSICDITYHNEFIDLLVIFMLENGYSNVVTLGFSSGSWEKSTNSTKFISKGYNSSIELLKSKEMEILKTIIGPVKFIELLLYWNAVFTPNNHLVWGYIKEAKYNTDNTSCIKGVKMNRIMFLEEKNLINCNPIDYDWFQILMLMFPNEFKPPNKCLEKDLWISERRKRISKRFRKLIIFLKMMINKHKKFETKYSYIYESICTIPKKPYTKQDNFSLVTPKRDVIKFVLTVLYSVIPLELFGSVHNRSVIASSVPFFLNNNVHYILKYSLILEKVKINEINWLRPKNGVKMNREEFIRGQLMFEAFLKWLFQIFISKLVAAYFHVTEPAKGRTLLFYTNNTWNQITKRFKSKYYKQHLVKSVDDESNSYLSFKENSEHIGNLKLLPKEHDFRMILKPFKGNREEKLNYLMYRKKFIRPINAILRELRSTSNEVLCESVDEVIAQVNNFKDGVKDENGKISNIFGIKFDIKQAYDSLSHEQIERIVQEKLNRYTKSDKISVQYEQVVEDGGKLGRQKLLVVDNMNKLNLDYKFTNGCEMKCSKARVSVDKHETFCFTKKNIIEFVRSQYSRSRFIKYSKKEKRSYTRKVGVYQGFPISGVLFNVIYDSVMEKMRNYIDIKVKDASVSAKYTIIRLVDDFLVLSVDQRVLRYIKKLISRRIEPFNANINRLKTKTSSEKLHFVGLLINLRNLTCYKGIKQYNVEPVRVSSINKLYKILNNYMESRLGSSFETLFNLNNCGATVTKFNLMSLFWAIVWKFFNSMNLNKFFSSFTLNGFKRWVSSLLNKMGDRVPLQKIGLQWRLIWPKVYRLVEAKLNAI